jgi:hypothetical protein
MGVPAVGEREVTADARLGVVTALACAVAYTTLVALPLRGDGWAVPTALAGPWAVATALALYVSPVATGLAAYASVTALAVHRERMPVAVRRLHLLTLALSATQLALCVATLGAAQLWLD